MNIENLKNMPVVGEDPVEAPAVSALSQIASAISAAGDNVKAFVTTERAEKESVAAANAAERAKAQAERLAQANQDITDHDSKYAEVKSDYIQTINDVVASLTANNEGDIDSILEGNNALVSASAAMDDVFLNFTANETSLNEAFQTQIGTAQQVANILAAVDLFGVRKQANVA